MKEDINGDYIVIVSEDLTRQEQLIAYAHEVDHITRGDLNSDIYVSEAEHEVHENDKKRRAK